MDKEKCERKKERKRKRERKKMVVVTRHEIVINLILQLAPL